jgi:hypothetical protein
MMGLFSQAGSHLRAVAGSATTRPRGSSNAEDRAPEDTEPDDTSILCVFFYQSPDSGSDTGFLVQR